MKITVVHTPSEKHLMSLGLAEWSLWSKEVSTFDWQYDAEEICFILEGEVLIHLEDTQVPLSAGDLVTFPAGLSCRWEITRNLQKAYKIK